LRVEKKGSLSGGILQQKSNEGAEHLGGRISTRKGLLINNAKLPTFGEFHIRGGKGETEGGGLTGKPSALLNNATYCRNDCGKGKTERRGLEVGWRLRGNPMFQKRGGPRKSFGRRGK